MISVNCDFSHFVAAIKDKPYNDIIYLADQEATAAERLLLRNDVDNDARKMWPKICFNLKRIYFLYEI